MNNQEYKAIYKKTVRQGTTVYLKTLKKLQPVYRDAAKIAADEVKKAVINDASDLTIQSWQNVNAQLTVGARQITEALDDKLRESVLKANTEVTAIDEKYLID
ncbi:MAG: hypothetical protein PVF17_13290, partial [Ignavibacteria bacterium]